MPRDLQIKLIVAIINSLPTPLRVECKHYQYGTDDQIRDVLIGFVKKYPELYLKLKSKLLHRRKLLLLL
jgi:hypothetical protein